MPTDQHIELTIDDQIGFISIERDKKLNALSWEMMLSLNSYVEDLDQNREIRAIIIYSKSPRAFGVGADINDWGALEPVEMWRKWTRHGHRIIRNIEELIHPVIAVVNGFAFGGSLEVALAADIRIGETGAKFGFPEALVGTIPGWLGTRKALDLIGPSRLKKLIFTGQPIAIEEALAIGLIDEQVPAGQGMERAKELAGQIRKSSPVATGLAKQVINSLTSGNSAAALESIASGLAAQTADGQEGKESFRTKRKPDFTGF